MSFRETVEKNDLKRALKASSSSIKVKTYSVFLAQRLNDSFGNIFYNFYWWLIFECIYFAGIGEK